MNRVLQVGVLAGCCAAISPGVAGATLRADEMAKRLGVDEQGLARNVNLTVADLRDYVDGAQRAGGLNADAVLLTLRHPKMMAAVPVTGQTVTRTTRAIPVRGCRFTESFTVLKSAAGIPLWRFGVKKYWCWNRDRRRVDANPKVFVDVKVPQAAAISGWRYAGLDKNGALDTLFRWNNAPGGAHLTIRRGVFQWCPPRFACFNTRRPTISITGYYDGHVADHRTIG
jgi:hypothetical protein